MRLSIAVAAAAASPPPSPPRLSRRTSSALLRRRRSRSRLASGDQPDVVLDIPNLSVESITLEVENLEVDIALDARLANLLKLTAGANAQHRQGQARYQGRAGPGDPDRPARQCPRDHRAHAADARQQSATRHPIALDRRQYGEHGRRRRQQGPVVGGVANNASTRSDRSPTRLRNGQLLDLVAAGLSQVSQTVNGVGQTVRQVRDKRGQLLEVVTDSANRIVSRGASADQSLIQAADDGAAACDHKAAPRRRPP